MHVIIGAAVAQLVEQHAYLIRFLYEKRIFRYETGAVVVVGLRADIGRDAILRAQPDSFVFVNFLAGADRHACFRASILGPAKTRTVICGSTRTATLLTGAVSEMQMTKFQSL